MRVLHVCSDCLTALQPAVGAAISCSGKLPGLGCASVLMKCANDACHTVLLLFLRGIT